MTKLTSVSTRSQISMDSDLQDALRLFEPSVSLSDSWEESLHDTAASRPAVTPLPALIQKGLRTGPGGPLYETNRARTLLPPDLQDEVLSAAAMLCSNDHSGIAQRSSIHAAFAQLSGMPASQRHQAYMGAQWLQHNNAAHPLETLHQLLTVAPQDQAAFVQDIERACTGLMTPHQKAFVVRQASKLHAPHDNAPPGHAPFIANGAAALAHMGRGGDAPVSTAEDVANVLDAVPSDQVPELMLAAACLQHGNSAPVCSTLQHLLRIEPGARVAFAMTVGGLAGAMQTGGLKADLAEHFASIPWALPFVVHSVCDRLAHDDSDETHLTEVGRLVPGLTFARALFECLEPPTARVGHVYADLLHTCFVGKPQSLESFIHRLTSARRDANGGRVGVEHAPSVLERLAYEAL